MSTPDEYADILPDIAVLLQILPESGRWLLVVHAGHIVKVARVLPEVKTESLVSPKALTGSANQVYCSSTE